LIVEYVVCYGSATGDRLGFLLLINIITVVGWGYTWNFKGRILIFMAEVWILCTCFLWSVAQGSLLVASAKMSETSLYTLMDPR
jgi:hypothetical protein